MTIHIKAQLDLQIYTKTCHKVRDLQLYSKLMKIHILESNIYKFPFFPLNSFIHHGTSILNMIWTISTIFFKKFLPRPKRKWV
jgi:hypothetical protein